MADYSATERVDMLLFPAKYCVIIDKHNHTVSRDIYLGAQGQLHVKTFGDVKIMMRIFICISILVYVKFKAMLHTYHCSKDSVE